MPSKFEKFEKLSGVNCTICKNKVSFFHPPPPFFLNFKDHWKIRNGVFFEIYTPLQFGLNICGIYLDFLRQKKSFKIS